MYLRILSLIPVFLLLINPAYSFPKGCEVVGFAYNGPHLVVNDKGTQTFYLIQNHSNKSIELQRLANPDEFMSPPLTAKMEPGNWGAFASDVSNMQFQCFLTEGHQPIACRDVLEVCQYPRVKFALSNMGNYWVSVNQTLRQVINEATAKGIYLRW